MINGFGAFLGSPEIGQAAMETLCVPASRTGVLQNLNVRIVASSSTEGSTGTIRASIQTTPCGTLNFTQSLLSVTQTVTDTLTTYCLSDLVDTVPINQGDAFVLFVDAVENVTLNVTRCSASVELA